MNPDPVALATDRRELTYAELHERVEATAQPACASWACPPATGSPTSAPTHRHLRGAVRRRPAGRGVRAAQHPAGRARARLHARRQRRAVLVHGPACAELVARRRPGGARGQARARRSRTSARRRPADAGAGAVARRAGRPRRPGADPLHLGHHRPAQGRHAHPRQHHLEHRQPARSTSTCSAATWRCASRRCSTSPGSARSRCRPCSRAARSSWSPSSTRRRSSRSSSAAGSRRSRRADDAADDVRPPRLGRGGPVAPCATCSTAARQVEQRVAQAWLDRGVVLQQGYGMTEAAPGVFLALPDGATARPTSAGVPHFFTDVELLTPGRHRTWPGPARARSWSAARTSSAATGSGPRRPTRC